MSKIGDAGKVNEIERLTAELDHALSDAACYRDEGYKLQARNEVLEGLVKKTAELMREMGTQSGQTISTMWVLSAMESVAIAAASPKRDKQEVGK